MLAPWKKSYEKPKQCIQKQRCHFAKKVHIIKAIVFLVVMYGCKNYTIKNWHFWTVVLEKTLENNLDSKEIKPVNPKGNQFWIFIGRTDAEAETPLLWPPDAQSWLIGKDPDAGKDWGARGEGDNGGWTGWMASLTQWAWVWTILGR